MPRSFLIRKFHSKMDYEQEKSTKDDECTETDGDSTTVYVKDNSTQNFREKSNSPQIERTTKCSTEVFTVGATSEVDTILKPIFQCESCSRSFNRASDLKRHQLAHIDAKPYRCQVCDRQFTWLGNFQKHFASHTEPASHFSFFADTPLSLFQTHPSSIFYEATPYVNAPMYLNNIPRSTFPFEYNHVHAAQRALTCNICFLTFTTARALKMHTRIHTGEKPYKCSQCSKAFARKDELHTHKYFHTGEKPFKCDKCSASFVRFGHLQRHRFVHYDVKPYQCKLCPKSFTQYRNLQTHMYKHTGERPYRCKYCPKGFTQYGTLQAHERTHTGERPFMCNKCDKRFITSSHLRWHVRTQHN